MELIAASRIKSQSWRARRAAELMGGVVVALLIDDLDSDYYGLRFKVPCDASPQSRSTNQQTFKYYDVWVLASEDCEAKAGYLDLVEDIAPKQR